MNKLITLLFILTAFQLKAQDELKELMVAHGRFTIGAYFSPEAAYRSLENTADSEQFNQLVERRNNSESPKFGYTTGLSIAYDLKNNFSLESGLQHSNRGFQHKISWSNLITNNIIDDRYGFTYNSSEEGNIETISFIDRLQYLGIPINLNYVAGRKKLKFISSIGVTAEYLFKASSVVVKHYDDKRPERDARIEEGYNRFNLSPQISLGVEYQFSDQMSLRAMPTFRAGLMPIIDAPVTGYVYNAGVLFGWYVRV
ncbi:MAG: outer membrane beta-barrel protein [Flavobacteriales bacterium]